MTRSGEDVTAVAGGRHFTVDQLFDLVANSAYADRLDVRYDPRGYPVLIDIDPSENTADEELTVTVPRLDPTA